jgi:5-deoxy-5-amino-3-dehydroquinate synthase
VKNDEFYVGYLPKAPEGISATVRQIVLGLIALGCTLAIGLVYAACLGRVLGRIDDDRVAEHVRVVGEEYGLGTALPARADRTRLVELMARDKKAVDGFTFVLDGADGVEVVAGVARGAIDDAFDLQAGLA